MAVPATVSFSSSRVAMLRECNSPFAISCTVTSHATICVTIVPRE